MCFSPAAPLIKSILQELTIMWKNGRIAGTSIIQRRKGFDFCKPIESIVEPIFDLVLADVYSCKNGVPCKPYNALTSNLDLPPKDFIAQLLKFAYRETPLRPGEVMYSVLECPVSKDGLGKMSLQFPLDSKTCIAWKFNKRSEFSTAITVPGNLTGPHMDNICVRQFDVHLFGRKLWMVWPPTPHNLKWMRDNNAIPGAITPEITRLAVQELEGLSLEYFNGDIQSFILPPATIHACISLSLSSHTGCLYQTMEDIDACLNLFEFANGHVTGSGAYEGKSYLLDYMKEEMKFWFNQRNAAHTSAVDKEKINRLAELSKC